MTRRTRTKEAVPISLCSDPTPERLIKSGGNFDIGDDKQGTRTYTFRDSPLDRMKLRGAISDKRHGALSKYRHHWYHSGMQYPVGSVDLNRVFASDVFSMGCMPKSEGQAHHRRQYREAVQELGQMRSFIVEAVVCRELALHDVGRQFGHKSEWRAREYVHNELTTSADILCKRWGF